MRHRYSILFISFFTTLTLHAQRAERYEPEDNIEIQEYDKEFTYGMHWNSRGGIIGGLNLKFGWQHKKIQTKYYFVMLDFSQLRHPKERRVLADINGTTWIYRKKYTPYIIRATVGSEKILFNKAQENGVQVSVMYGGGLSLAYLKPYYVFQGDSIQNAQAVPFQESFLDGNIYGGAGFWRGFDAMKSELGAHVRLSLNFEYGKFRNNVAGVETGMLIDTYTKPIVILPDAKNRAAFILLFLSLYVGFR